jgi:hypothetical protein
MRGPRTAHTRDQCATCAGVARAWLLRRLNGRDESLRTCKRMLRGEGMLAPPSSPPPPPLSHATGPSPPASNTQCPNFHLYLSRVSPRAALSVLLRAGSALGGEGARGRGPGSALDDDAAAEGLEVEPEHLAVAVAVEVVQLQLLREHLPHLRRTHTLYLGTLLLLYVLGSLLLLGLLCCTFSKPFMLGLSSRNTCHIPPHRVKACV